MGKHTELPEYSQGVLADGAAILKDGQMMKIEEIVSELSNYRDNHARLVEALRWYAQHAKDARKFGRDGEFARSEIDSDGGQKGLTLLAQLEGELE